MKKYHNIDNKKLMLKLEKPRLLHILSNNKFHYKINPKNLQNKYNHNTSLSPLLKGRNNNANILNNIQNIKNNCSPIKTTNFLKNTPGNLIKTTPLKFQYKKIPFEKVKGFKLKLPDSPLNNKHKNHSSNKNKLIINTQQNYYPIIHEHNHSTIQINKNKIKEKENKRSCSNLNYNNIIKKNAINSINNTINAINDTFNSNINNTIQENNNLNNNKNPYSLLNEGKSSSIGSKLETREESRHFNQSKSKSFFPSGQIINTNSNFVKDNLIQENLHFLKNNKLNKIKLSSKKKIIKYLDQTIKQLTRLKTIILDGKDYEYEDYKEEKNDNNIGKKKDKEKINEEIKNKFIKIDLSKIGKNLEKYKNKIDIDKNTINISFDGNDNKIYPYNYNGSNQKAHKSTLKKLNKTIAYEDLKFNVKEKQKFLQIEQKSFKNFKKVNLNHKRNKSDNSNKYNTVSNYTDDYLSYKMLKNNDNNNYRIKDYDTEIKIPKLNINFEKKDIEGNNENCLNKIKEEEMSENIDINKINDRYNVDNKSDINVDITNFEFSD